jgi:hypothetical protein
MILPPCRGTAGGATARTAGPALAVWSGGPSTVGIREVRGWGRRHADDVSGRHSGLPAEGSDFLLQMHFHLSGKPETERSSPIALPTERRTRLFSVELPALFGLGAASTFPRREAHTIQDSFTFPRYQIYSARRTRIRRRR